MRWQIAQFIFCDQQQTLTSNHGSVQLEPMMVELLSFFCHNVDQIISKDTLIEQVWLGRIVSDNAVSKLITKLRKVFSDDARQPKFIATFPKKGYKFIAHAEQIVKEIAKPINADAAQANNNGDRTSQILVQDNITSSNGNLVTTTQAPTEVHDSSRNKALWLFVIITSIILITIISLNTLRQQPQQIPLIANHAKALTTDAGDEMFPDVSPDGTRVVYMSVRNDRINLLIKNVINESIVEISHEDNMYLGPASWSADGKLIAYLAATPQQCQYYIRTISDIELGEPQLIHNCVAGSYGKILFTHDNNRLVYTENSGPNTPYSLFEIDLTTNKIKRLNQPEMFLAGNSQFDLHPIENKLLISSPDKQQWEGFYSLDLETDQLTLLFKQDAYICCGIWSHSGTRVVLMGEYPAYQLLSYDLAGKDKQIIYSGSLKLRSPSRHNNGTDYLFSSGQNNYNLHLENISTQQQRVIANNSVDEKLATFAHHNNQIAYIGLASGTEEIWLTTTENKQRVKLTQFNDSRHYVDLMWSPSGEYLLALTFNEMHLINSLTGQFERLKIPQTQIRGVSFKSAESVAYSIKENNQWRVYSYQLDTQTVKAEDSKWQFVQYQITSDNTLWLDQDNKLFFGESQTPVVTQKISANSLVNGRRFNLQKRGQLWLWFERTNGNKIQSYSEQNKTLTTLVETDVEYFDFLNNQLLYGKVEQINTNIYQTQSLDNK
ncbi:winged helix-turn-helix domain-containing protein [Colwelliaceae bacterium BS250]